MSTMTDTMTAGAPVLSAEQRAHARNVGFTYLGLAVVSLLLFTRHDGTATFNLDAGRSIGVNAPGLAYALGVFLAALGAIQLIRGLGKASLVLTSVAAAGFVLTFLAWAAAGQSFSFTGLLQDAVTRCVPITLGAVAGLLCERSGVINIAIEGMLLGGAFAGTVVGSVSSPWLGILAAMAVGTLLALLLAVFAIRYRVDQVIIGFAINFFVLGVTSFLTSRVLVDRPEWNHVTPFTPWKVPALNSIPVIGTVFFEQTLFVYATFIIVAVVTWAMYRTKWGLRTRAIGEHPKAAGSVGIKVLRMRYQNLAIAGAIAGFGGAWWPVGAVGRFDQNITNGRGFIALAAVIFGRWNPVGALSAALVFAFSESLRIKIGNLDSGIPSEFLTAAPYIVTLVVVAGFVGRSRGPKAAGVPYDEQ